MLTRLREWLSTKRLLAIGAVTVLLFGAVAFFLFSTPTVSGIDNGFGDVNESTTTVESDLHLQNPNPVGASLGGLTVTYAIDMNGIRMATGVKEGVAVPKGESTMPMATHLANERIPPWWVSHVRNGERTELAVNANVHSSLLGASFGAPKVTRTIETDIISAFNSTESRPVGEDPTGGPYLVIEETSATWGSVDASRTVIEMEFVVRNPNSYPVPVSELGYRATMNDVVMGTGTTEGHGTIAPGETRTIETETVLRNENIDEWWVSHLQNDQVTDLRIDFSATLDVGTRTVEIPLDGLTYTRTIETDIFGNGGNETADGGDGSSTATATATPTPTDGSLVGGEETETPDSTAEPTSTDDGLLDGADGTPTATPTATPEETATPTPAPTPTDDGDLLSIRAAPWALPAR